MSLGTHTFNLVLQIDDHDPLTAYKGGDGQE